MFWRLGFAQSSPIDTLLDSDDYTLQQLLDEDDLVQECKQLNNKLLDYLSLPEQVEAMVNYIVDAPAEDASDKLKFVYPYKSSEVLSSDVGSIHDCLLGHEALLDKLFAIINAEEGKLNLMQAGFFSKVITAMINYRPEDTLSVLDSRSALPLLLRHLSTYSILELLLKVVQEAEEAGSGSGDDGGWCAWLVRQDMVPQLLDKLDSANSAQVHDNVSGALIWILSQHGQMHWVSTPTLRRAPLAKRLLEPDMVAMLLDKCLTSNGATANASVSAVEHGISVVVEVAKVASKELDKDVGSMMMPKTPDPNDDAPEQELGSEQRQSRLESAVAPDTALGKILQRLEDLVMLLHKPPPMAAIINSTGKLDPPLGVVRLKVLELIAMLVALDNPVVEERLASLKVLPAVLDIFFKYEWHNLLHNLVCKMLEPVIAAEAPSGQRLKHSLLEDGKLLPRIIKAHADNDEHVKQPKQTRKGYMGQLRLLAVAVVKAAQSDKLVRKHTDSAEWKEFLKAHSEITDDLINDTNKSTTGSPSHKLSLSRDSDSGEVPDLEDTEGSEDAGVVPIEPESALLTSADSPSRETPPDKPLPAAPKSPDKSPNKSSKKMQTSGKGAVVEDAVEALVQVVANVTLSLRIQDGRPIASAQVGLKVA